MRKCGAFSQVQETTNINIEERYHPQLFCDSEDRSENEAIRGSQVTVHRVAVPRRCWSDGCHFGRRVNSNDHSCHAGGFILLSEHC